MASSVVMRRLAQSAVATHVRCAVSRLASTAAEATTVNPFTGVWTIVATPFHSDREETLDLESFARCIRFMKRAGVDGVTITGVLGESNRLIDSERASLIETAVGAADGMPVCVGVSHPGTSATAALAVMARDLGAAAVMVTPSLEPTPATPAKIGEYFAAVAAAAPELAIVLQDHPASTRVHMSLSLIADICEELPQVRSVKLESTPTPSRTKELISMLDQRLQRPRPTILTGLGGLYGGFELAAGADGFMTGFAFPEVLKAMVICAKRGAKGDPHGMHDCMKLYKEYLPLMVFEQQPGVAVRKHVYKMRGMIGDAHVRHPGGQLSPAARDMVETLIAQTFPAGVTEPLNWQRGAFFSLPLQ